MSKHQKSLIEEIDAFLERSGMGPTYFGKAAVGNSEVVARLRSNGRVWPETEKKLRAFMRANRAKIQSKGAAA